MGDDTYIVDNVGDVVTENASAGTDTVKTTLATFTLGTNVENLTFIGAGAFIGTGNAASNVIMGGAGNDTLDGAVGADTMIGGAGNDTYLVDNAGDIVTEALNAGTDTVKTALNAYALSANVENLTFTGSGDFTGTGSAVANTITGGSGNDTLDGGAGADTLIGGMGDDTYIIDNTADVITEGASAGADTVKTTLVAYTLAANLENLTYTGVAAFAGTGNATNNTITGGVGNDTLDGSTGADTLIGGAGNDTYIVDNASDTVNEGANAGTDSVKTTLNAYALGANLENLTFTGTGAFTGTGNAASNIISGGAGNDTLDGGAGADTLIGGAGDDTYLIDNTGDIITEAVNAGNDTVKTTANIYTLGANIENLTFIGSGVFTGTGSAVANVIVGGASNDKLSGGDGNDTLDGGAGADALIGGTGDDTYFVDNAGDVITEAAKAGTDTVKTSINAYALSANVENLTFTGTGNFVGTGSAVANIITGGAGNDTLDGGAGADKLIGGAGDDIYIVDNAGDVIVELASGGTDTVKTTAVTYALGAEIENLTYTGVAAFTGTGNAANNIITGGKGNDTLNGGAGTDTLIGGAGNDTYIVDDAGDVIVEATAGGTDTVKTIAVTYTLGAEIENLTYTGTSSFTGTGNALANTITGGIGADTLDGGAGADKLIGGAGNDTYIVDNAGDVVTEGTNAGTDTVKTALAAYTLGLNVENLTFTGSVAFAGTGNAANNVITGGALSDTLNGGKGADALIGGLGDDTYMVDNIGDIVTEAASAGTDTVKTTLAAYTLGSDVENLTFTGAVAFTGTGNGLDNVITGGAKSDILYGGIGNDTLNGAAGNDTLNGGVGADIMLGGVGNDIYIVDNAGDVVTEASNGGTDIVQTALAAYALGLEVENLTYTGTAAFTGTGNALNNIITGGIGADTLNGGLGADTLIGGAGNDIYIVDNVKDIVKEGVGAGIDTVQTTLAAYTLGADLENLTYTGSADFTGTGNALGNTITGGIGNDTLNGGAGADTLIGGAGNDTYLVDNAGDVVTEAASAGTDTVKTTLAAYTLGSDVENLTFTGKGAFTGTGNGLDNVITGGTGADTLYGNAGIDTLIGGAGNDTLNGGTGADSLIGGAGNDTFVVDNAGDVVTEATNAGTDLVQTTLASYTLAANVENLTFTGAGAFTGTGNAAKNIITGGASGDTLDGGAGNDTLSGGGGDDTLIGGAGVDILQGGLGADVFRFVTATDSKGKTYDTITDFLSAQNDKIDLSSFDADTKTAGIQSFMFINSAAFTGVAGQLSFSKGFLRADLNGDKVSDFDVALTGVTNLTINDFLL